MDFPTNLVLRLGVAADPPSRKHLALGRQELHQGVELLVVDYRVLGNEVLSLLESHVFNSFCRTMQSSIRTRGPDQKGTLSSWYAPPP